MLNKENIPLYNLNTLYDINIEDISHKNDYNFNAIHRHNYYEILFFEEGGGFQIIDFKKVPIKANSCYVIKPKQIHLLKRDSNADGLLIQFTDKMILPDVFLMTLSSLKLHVGVTSVFEEHLEHSRYFMSLLKTIRNLQKSKGRFYKERSIHLLSSFLYALEDVSENQNKEHLLTDKNIIKFIDLVEKHLNTYTINSYAECLNMSSKKLSLIVKSQLGMTPLNYIHNILLLNIKRDLVFKQLSFKEIAYNYNFDSPSNFSIFIKKQTGKTPSQLQEMLNYF